MKFLLNMNISRELGRQLELQGHSFRHVGDVGMARAADVDIVAEARAHQETIITHDLDYGYLLTFSGDASPSVIIFRVRNSHPLSLFNRLIKTWSMIEDALIQGAIVVLEDATMRVRKLPISGED